jgi:hypothetical protein
MLAGLAYTYKYDQLEYRIRQKIKQSAGTSVDERVALRNATIQMITADGKRGQIWYGWGAGSYRWVSPYFQAKQPALQDSKHRLATRAIYAHCDWLQMVAEWGVVGILPVIVGLNLVYHKITTGLSSRPTRSYTPFLRLYFIFNTYVARPPLLVYPYSFYFSFHRSDVPLSG